MYHKQWLGKNGLLFPDSCLIKVVQGNSHTQQEYEFIVPLRRWDNNSSCFHLCWAPIHYTASESLPKSVISLHPNLSLLCVGPLYSIHTIITVTAKKCRQLAPRSVTSMCWTPIQDSHHHNSHCQTIIRVTVNKCR